jgi:hypothetical protein
MPFSAWHKMTFGAWNIVKRSTSVLDLTRMRLELKTKMDYCILAKSENLTKFRAILCHNNFWECSKCSWKYKYSKHFRENVKNKFCFRLHFHENKIFSRKYWYSKRFWENVCFREYFCDNFSFSQKCLRKQNIYIFQTLSCPGCTVQVAYQADLSSPTCLCCPVPVIQSQMSCPRCPILTSLSCPGWTVPAALPRPLCLLLSWHHYHFQTVLSSLSFPHSPSRLTCRSTCWDSSVPTALPQLFCLGCPVLDVMFRLSCPSCSVPCHVPDVLSP